MPGGDDEHGEIRQKQIDQIAAREIFRARDRQRGEEHADRRRRPRSPGDAT